MVITKPMLPPKRGYVEDEVNGVRTYRNAVTGVLIDEEETETTDVWAELDAAYQRGYAEGVNSVE